jgi:hypothetical protein
MSTACSTVHAADTEDFQSYSAPVYQVMTTFTCKTPILSRRLPPVRHRRHAHRRRHLLRIATMAKPEPIEVPAPPDEITLNEFCTRVS